MAGQESLESWKDISGHLGRSVKTCQRWEREFGLPIHRLEGTAKSRVWAVVDELESWIKDKFHLAAASEPVRSLAVLPLRNLTGDPSQDPIAEGLTEALITEIGQVRDFRVISHQSTQQFAATKLPLPEIARILHIDAIIEGAVLEAGERIRITANLVKAVPERHLWAHDYECRRSELTGIQREIARAVAREAGVELSPGEEARLSGRRDVVSEAYDLYLRGKAALRRSFVQLDIERALNHYEKAVAVDPGFAAAWAELAWCHGQLGFHSFVAPSEAFVRQKEAAARALGLDPLLAEAHTMLGFHSFASDWDWPGAELHLKRALELNPSSFWANTYSVWFMTCTGKHEKADEIRAQLLAIDPLNPENHWTLGWDYFWAKRHDDAIATFSRLLEQAPDDHWLRMARGANYSFKNLHEEAIRDCDLARSGVPVGLDIVFDLFIAYCFARAGLPERAHDTLKKWDEIVKERPIDPLAYTAVHLGLGNEEIGLEYLERGYEERRPWMVYAKVAPFYDSIRGEPRFLKLLKKMNFPES